MTPRTHLLFELGQSSAVAVVTAAEPGEMGVRAAEALENRQVAAAAVAAAAAAVLLSVAACDFHVHSVSSRCV